MDKKYTNNKANVVKTYHVQGGSEVIHLQHQVGWSSHQSLPQLSGWGQIWVLLGPQEEGVPCNRKKNIGM